MKKYILMPIVALFALANVYAQDFDNTPAVKIQTQEGPVFTIGARMMGDVAYYHSDFTPLKSGATLSDARIRTSMKYNNWYFYADFDFSKGKFKQKDIYLQHTWKDLHALKVGYYCDPTNMAGNTSIGSYHFISRSAATRALSAGRELGVSYKYMGKHFFANAGVFAENLYNDQLAGFQGMTISGRLLYRNIKSENSAFHVGLNLRGASILTGENYQGTVKTSVTLSTPFETYVDGNTDLMNAYVPWASGVSSTSLEFAWVSPKVFARGEYIFQTITKKRDDETLFKNQLGTEWSWATLESWKKGNPLEDSNFHGGYVEAGVILFGGDYRYDRKNAIVGGIPCKSLELVARYSYTNLNDIKDGAYYFLPKDQYIDEGMLLDYPAASTSIGGGRMHAATIGLNYSFNKYVQVLLDYTYSNYQRDKNPYDKNFHAVQGRVIFSF